MGKVRLGQNKADLELTMHGPAARWPAPFRVKVLKGSRLSTYIRNFKFIQDLQRTRDPPFCGSPGRNQFCLVAWASNAGPGWRTQQAFCHFCGSLSLASRLMRRGELDCWPSAGCRYSIQQTKGCSVPKTAAQRCLSCSCCSSESAQKTARPAPDAAQKMSQCRAVCAE